MADSFGDCLPGRATRLGVRKVSEIRLRPRIPETPSIKRSTDFIKTLSETQRRWRVATLDRAFATLRTLPLLETRAEHLLRAIEKGRVATNVDLRRIHNFALSIGWLPWPIIPKRQWPQVRFKEKRAITRDEHRRIVEREPNPERRAFYELAWHLGGAQGDIANLAAEDIDWERRVIAYFRRKTESPALIRFGDDVDRVLRQLPASGPLFPNLRGVRASDRATEFKQRCRGLGIEGVTLHSYRYAWAERPKTAGYPERFAQEALGHNSKAVRRAYARHAEVTLTALDAFEKTDPAVPASMVNPVNSLGQT